MANSANNTIIIRGEKENLDKALDILEGISYCGDTYVDRYADNECEVIFYSKWCEPMATLLKLSEENSLEFDGYTREPGTGYYSEWVVKNGKKISRYYCNLKIDLYDVCPNCGNEDFFPNEIEAGNGKINYVWLCAGTGVKDCNHEEVVSYNYTKVGNAEELLVTPDNNKK